MARRVSFCNLFHTFCVGKITSLLVVPKADLTLMAVIVTESGELGSWVAWETLMDGWRWIRAK